MVVWFCRRNTCSFLSNTNHVLLKRPPFFDFQLDDLSFDFQFSIFNMQILQIWACSEKTKIENLKLKIERFKISRSEIEKCFRVVLKIWVSIFNFQLSFFKSCKFEHALERWKLKIEQFKISRFQFSIFSFKFSIFENSNFQSFKDLCFWKKWILKGTTFPCDGLLFSIFIWKIWVSILNFQISNLANLIMLWKIENWKLKLEKDGKMKSWSWGPGGAGGSKIQDFKFSRKYEIWRFDFFKSLKIWILKNALEWFWKFECWKML